MSGLFGQRAMGVAKTPVAPGDSGRGAASSAETLNSATLNSATLNSAAPNSAAPDPAAPDPPATDHDNVEQRCLMWRVILRDICFNTRTKLASGDLRCFIDNQQSIIMS